MPAGRPYTRQAAHATEGVVNLDFSFVANGTDTVDKTTFRGEGVASVAYASATGQFLVTLQDSYRYCITHQSSIHDLDHGSTPDAARATIGEFASDYSTFYLYTWDKAGSATNFTGRRVNISLVLKRSVVGK